MHWVTTQTPGETAAQHMLQISNPIFKVTGGEMYRIEDESTLLVFGQDFEGFYEDGATQEYTYQVRRFKISYTGTTLSVKILNGEPLALDPNYRRRDLNVVPVTLHREGHNHPYLIAFAGVFTPETGVWTVPVRINKHGHTHMDNPAEASTFKQAMNQYQCATLSLFSKKHKSAYVSFFGGISYGFFQNGTFQTDEEFPFINDVTTITIDKKGNYTQYLMDSSYPVIPSTQSNPGNTLLFGAESHVIVAEGVPRLHNRVIDFDSLSPGPTLVGYIIGGIQSTLPNTNVASDSSASPRIFSGRRLAQMIFIHRNGISSIFVHKKHKVYLWQASLYFLTMAVLPLPLPPPL